MKKGKVLVCPQCGSLNVKSTLLLGQQEGAVPLAMRFREGFVSRDHPDVMVCKACEYYGVCLEISMREIKNFRMKLKQKKESKQNGFKAESSGWASKMLFLYLIVVLALMWALTQAGWKWFVMIVLVFCFVFKYPYELWGWRKDRR